MYQNKKLKVDNIYYSSKKKPQKRQTPLNPEPSNKKIYISQHYPKQLTISNVQKYSQVVSPFDIYHQERKIKANSQNKYGNIMSLSDCKQEQKTEKQSFLLGQLRQDIILIESVLRNYLREEYDLARKYVDRITNKCIHQYLSQLLHLKISPKNPKQIAIIIAQHNAYQKQIKRLKDENLLTKKQHHSRHYERYIANLELNHQREIEKKDILVKEYKEKQIAVNCALRQIVKKEEIGMEQLARQVTKKYQKMKDSSTKNHNKKIKEFVPPYEDYKLKYHILSQQAQQQTERFHNQLNTYKSQLKQQYEKQYREICKQIHELKFQLSEKQKIIKKLNDFLQKDKASFKDIYNEIQDIKLQKNLLQCETDELRKDKEAAQRVNQKLIENKNIVSRQKYEILMKFQDQQKICSNLIEENKRLMQTTSDYRYQSEKIMQKIKNQSSQHSSKVDQFYKQQIANLKKEIKDKQKMIDNQDQERHHLQKRIGDLLKKQITQSQNQENESYKNNMKQLLEQVHLENFEIKNIIQQLQLSKMQLQKEKIQTQEKFQAIFEEINLQKEEQKEKVVFLSNQIQILKKQRQSIENSYQNFMSMDETIDKKNWYITVLDNKIKEKETFLSSIQGKVYSHASQTVKQERYLKEISEKISQKQQKLNEMMKELQQFKLLKSQMQELESLKQKQEMESVKLQIKNNNLKIDLANQKRQLECLNQQILKKENQLKEIHAQNVSDFQIKNFCQNKSTVSTQMSNFVKEEVEKSLIRLVQIDSEIYQKTKINAMIEETLTQNQSKEIIQYFSQVQMKYKKIEEMVRSHQWTK